MNITISNNEPDRQQPSWLAWLQERFVVVEKVGQPRLHVDRVSKTYCASALCCLLQIFHSLPLSISRMLCLHLPPSVVQGWLRKFESSWQGKLLWSRFPVSGWCATTCDTISHYTPQLRLWQSLFGAPQGHRWWQALRHENVSLAWLVTASVLKLWDWRLSKPHIQPQNIRDKAGRCWLNPQRLQRISGYFGGISSSGVPHRVTFPMVPHGSPWFLRLRKEHVLNRWRLKLGDPGVGAINPY